MGAAAPKSEEFFWTDTTEPHAARRRAILAKYGDKVRALYGYDHSTAVQVMLLDISTGPLQWHRRHRGKYTISRCPVSGCQGGPQGRTPSSSLETDCQGFDCQLCGSANMSRPALAVLDLSAGYAPCLGAARAAAHYSAFRLAPCGWGILWFRWASAMHPGRH